MDFRTQGRVTIYTIGSDMDEVIYTRKARMSWISHDEQTSVFGYQSNDCILISIRIRTKSD